MNRMGQAFNITGKSVGDAFTMWDKAQGVATDPMERMYNNLKPEDFNDLILKFGTKPVSSYIKMMEIKRMNSRR